MDETGPDFDFWYRREHPRLIASLVLVTGDVGLAAEAVDEACLRALIRWDRVAAMASPGGWVYRVALHEARRRRRRASVEHRLLSRRRVDQIAPAPAGEAWDVVRQLPPRQRAAIVLRYVADLTEADIAEAMGISRGTVSSTLFDARRAMARLLGSELEDREDRHA